MSNSVPPITYQRRALFVLGVVFALRLLYAAVFAKNPAGDEAYYWDWGRQLDYGYYSKPPLIAWIYAFVDWIGHGSLFAFRATAAALGTLSLFMLYKLSASLFDERTGWFTVLLGIAAPANAVLSFFLTIDAPLVFCWAMALWMLWRYLSEPEQKSSLAWLFLALAAGHLCKQMMMLFPLLSVIFLALHSETRPFLKRPGLQLTLFGSYLSLIPPLVWNAKHDWITFKHTGHHFEVKGDGGNPLFERLEDFFSFVGTQFGVLSPGTAFVLFSLCLTGLPLLRRADRPVRFLLTFGALPVAAMLLLALRQSMQPNWPAVYYLCGIVLTAAWYNGKLQFALPGASLRRLFPVTIGFGAAFVAFFYLGPVYFAAVGKSGHLFDPNRRLLGHDLVAAEFDRLRMTVPNANDHFLVALGHRDITSQLAFGLPDQPRVYRWESQDRISSQYEMWNNPSEDGLGGKDAIILAPNAKELPRQLSRAFDEVEKVGEFKIRFSYTRERSFAVFRGRTLKLWPSAR
jgi:4-amino-4-deoxy-L-arabinose transferase-like glycosyltransferase